MLRCKTTEEIVSEVNRLIREEGRYHPEKGAEFFFRGEALNHSSTDDAAPLGTAFSCYLDRESAYRQNEREMYEEALRLNVASFREDVTMVERIARMQHHQLPTRFADMSFNALLSTHFACGGGECNESDKDNGRDGFVRIIKIAKHKMKSFSSDIIIAISHLPLVDAKDVNPSQDDGLGKLSYEIKNNRTAFWTETDWKEIGQQLRTEMQQVWAFKPVLNTAQVRAQGGAFLAFGCRDGKEPLNPTFSPSDYDNRLAPSYGIKQIGYVQIAAEAKTKIREELRHFGMSGEIAYPEISNVCTEIANRTRKGS